MAIIHEPVHDIPWEKTLILNAGSILSTLAYTQLIDAHYRRYRLSVEYSSATVSDYLGHARNRQYTAAYLLPHFWTKMSFLFERT